MSNVFGKQVHIQFSKLSGGSRSGGNEIEFAGISQETFVTATVMFWVEIRILTI